VWLVDLSHHERVNSLAAKVRALPGYPSFPGIEAAGRARYDHMGALLADAALQAAIDFNSVVKPRVQRLLAAWPEADTVAHFLVRVRAEGLNQVLGWADAEKPARAVRLADLLADEGVDTVDELRTWSLLPGSWAKLLKVKGVGEKTADYIAMLAGAPAVAVDRRIRAFVGSGTDEQIRGLLAAVATDLDIDLGVLDRVVWAAGKRYYRQTTAQTPSRSPSRCRRIARRGSATSPNCGSRVGPKPNGGRPITSRLSPFGGSWTTADVGSSASSSSTLAAGSAATNSSSSPEPPPRQRAWSASSPTSPA
jgi:hypothetical protein